jgi:hypothetical protein
MRNLANYRVISVSGHPLHAAATATTVTASVVHRLIIIWRIGGVRRLPWPGCHLDTADEYQYDGYHDEPSMQIH